MICKDYNKPDGYACNYCNSNKIFKCRSNFSRHQKSKKHIKNKEYHEKLDKEVAIAVALSKPQISPVSNLEINYDNNKVYNTPKNIGDCPLPFFAYDGKIEHNLATYCQKHWKGMSIEKRPLYIQNGTLHVYNDKWFSGLEATAELDRFARDYSDRTLHLVGMLKDGETNEKVIDNFIHNTSKATAPLSSKELLWKCHTFLEVKTR